MWTATATGTNPLMEGGGGGGDDCASDICGVVTRRGSDVLNGTNAFVPARWLLDPDHQPDQFDDFRIALAFFFRPRLGSAGMTILSLINDSHSLYLMALMFFAIYSVFHNCRSE